MPAQCTANNTPAGFAGDAVIGGLEGAVTKFNDERVKKVITHTLLI